MEGLASSQNLNSDIGHYGGGLEMRGKQACSNRCPKNVCFAVAWASQVILTCVSLLSVKNRVLKPQSGCEAQVSHSSQK